MTTESAVGPILSDERIEVEAKKYALFVRPDGQESGDYDVTRYECREDFFNCVRACAALVAVSGKGEPVVRMERFAEGTGAYGKLRPAWLGSMPPEGTLLYAAQPAPVSGATSDEQLTTLLLERRKEIVALAADTVVRAVEDRIIAHVVVRACSAAPVGEVVAAPPEQVNPIDPDECPQWTALLDAADAYIAKYADDPCIMIDRNNNHTYLGIGTKAQFAMMCDGRSGAQMERDTVAEGEVVAAPDLAKLTRYDAWQGMSPRVGPVPEGRYVLLSDVERLFAALPPQAPATGDAK